MNVHNQYLNYAVIDLDAIAHNIQQIKKHIGSRVELFAVVKANAYGHGAVQVSKTALENGASRLAVSRVIEGVELRRNGIKAPILIMGYSMVEEANTIVEYDLTSSVQNIEIIQALSYWAEKLNKTAKIHVKVDTGMCRYGVLPDEMISFLDRIKSLPSIDIEGIFTHFSSASESDKTFTFQQYSVFTNVIEQAQRAGYNFRLCHAANSATTLHLPEMYLDGVRTGIAIYGLNPFDDQPPSLSLKPALTLKSHVARIRTLPAGSSISYGRTYKTVKSTPVALIPIGYGDGYHRILSNCGKVLIHGKIVPIIGRVCMDQFVVDVSDVDQLKENDEVVLIGKQQDVELSAEEVAAAAQTINYEVTTSILPRIPRIFLRHNQVVEINQLISV